VHGPLVGHVIMTRTQMPGHCQLQAGSQWKLEAPSATARGPVSWPFILFEEAAFLMELPKRHATPLKGQPARTQLEYELKLWWAAVNWP
jgi:hypothetical protein